MSSFHFPVPLVDPAVVPPVGKVRSRVDCLMAYFAKRPGLWIDGRELAGVAGVYGWRTRVSDCRKRGMTIANRIRVVYDHAPNCPGVQAWDMAEACRCGRPAHYTVSEYRYQPEG